MPISFERSGTVLSPVIADSNTNASFNELSHSFRWMSSPPLMIPSVYWSFIKLAWRTLWYQTKTFRFSAATLCLFKSEMKEQGCSLNDALVSLIITTLFVANRDRTQRKRGMHVAQIINERGQNNIPVGYIGNAHGAFTNVISVEVLEQAAIALTKFCNLEAISPIDKQLAKLNREWLLHVRTSGTIFEQLAWFDRVHYSGFNRKLGPGTAASLYDNFYAYCKQFSGSMEISLLTAFQRQMMLDQCLNRIHNTLYCLLKLAQQCLQPLAWYMCSLVMREIN